MRGVGGSSVLTELVVANYDLVDKGAAMELWDGQLDLADSPSAKAAPNLVAPTEVRAAADAAPFAKSIPLIKGLDPGDERFVLGIVLEPEVIDAQGDIYSPDEIRQAAHRFMEEFGGLGLMHRMRVNGQVKVLESYVSPVDFTAGEAAVRKGTWLLAVRILSDALWEQVKSGELTGFSIGGSARRVPEADAPAPQPQKEAA